MNVLSRFRVAVQIGAGFLVGVLLLAVVAVVGIGRVNVMHARANEAAALDGISTLSRDVMVQMLDQASAVRGYVATGDSSYVDSMHAADVQLKSDLNTLDQSDQTNAVDSARLEQIDIETAQIESDIDAVKKGFARQLELAAKNRLAAAAELSKGQAAFGHLRRDDDALLKYASEQAKVASEQFNRALVVVVTVLILSTIAAALALVLTALYIGGAIARRLRAVTSALLEVTEHDVAALTMAFDRFILERGDDPQA